VITPDFINNCASRLQSVRETNERAVLRMRITSTPYSIVLAATAANWVNTFEPELYPNIEIATSQPGTEK